jgi:hypothetical protein
MAATSHAYLSESYIKSRNSYDTLKDGVGVFDGKDITNRQYIRPKGQKESRARSRNSHDTEN